MNQGLPIFDDSELDLELKVIQNTSGIQTKHKHSFLNSELTISQFARLS